MYLFYVCIVVGLGTKQLKTRVFNIFESFLSLILLTHCFSTLIERKVSHRSLRETAEVLLRINSGLVESIIMFLQKQTAVRLMNKQFITQRKTRQISFKL